MVLDANRLPAVRFERRIPMKVVPNLFSVIMASALLLSPPATAFDDFDIDALFEGLDETLESTTTVAPVDSIEDLDWIDDFDDLAADGLTEDEWVEPITEWPVVEDSAEDSFDFADDWDDFPGADTGSFDAVEPAPSEVAAPSFDLFFDEEPAELVLEEEFAPDMPELFDFADEAPAEVRADIALEESAPAEDLARQLAIQEEIRRQAAEDLGLRNLDAGFRALDRREFREAQTAFDRALKEIPDRPANRDLRNRARWGLAESYYRTAQQALSDGEVAAARTNLDRALAISPDHAGTGLLQRRIARAEARAVADRVRPVPVERRPEFAERARSVADMMEEGIAYYDAGDLNRSEVIFENVLVRDEYNRDAMRYLRRIAEDKRAAADTLRQTTSEQMMADVRDAWNPPRRDTVVLPEDLRGPTPTDLVTPARRLQEKMESIVIPRIEFRQANIRDVVSFLRDASEAADPVGEGVNIILNLSVGDAPAAPTPAPRAPATAFDDPWAADPWGAVAPALEPAGPSGVPTITLNLRRITLMEAIRYITEVAGLNFRIEDNVVVILPAGIADRGRVITRLYPVQPSFLDIVAERQEDTPAPTGFGEFGARRPATTARGADVKAFFVGAGVPFPVGTSISYNPAISQLIVANTPENLDRFERILSQLNVVPSQVEIEARFVEVAEDDMKELGLQWLFTDNYQFLQRRGTAPLGGQERIQVNEGNVSGGTRFFGRTDSGINPLSPNLADAPSYAGSILSISSILTNPELTVVLHALSQQGNTDVLSAPRVTTRSGVNATIEVVREIIYPTEFRQEVRDIDVLDPETGARVTRTVVNVTPDNFEMRKTGVILNVTPTVGPDGYTIDLELAPEVAELTDWIQYGSTYAGERINIPQPVFSSRNVSTRIVIWDGQTVVMGGLMTERLITINDKIPFLGDIPIIGRLFRNEASKSRKENLLIFVTARLVDPAGKPIHRADAMSMAGQSLD
jgi:general secretion pathway protein D